MSMERRPVSWKERESSQAEEESLPVEERRDEIRAGWWLLAIAASCGVWLLIGLAILRL